MSASKTTITKNRISILLLDIEAGKTYMACSKKYCQDWSVAFDTFRKYWNMANAEYKLILEKKKKAVEEVIIEKAVEVAHRTLMTKNDKLEWLESVIHGEKDFPITYVQNGKTKTVFSKPSLKDRLSALDMHNKLTGEYVSAISLKVPDAIPIVSQPVQGQSVDELFKGEILSLMKKANEQ